MKRLFCIFLLVVATVSSAAPLTKYQNLSTAMRSTVSDQGLFVKGLGENNWYAFEVDPATGAWPVSGSFSLSNDTNYGVVGANTLRGAAQIGNATGAADFGAGNSSAQTLRAVIATNQSALPASQSGTWTVQPGNTANTTPWLATVSQGGNSATVSAGGALKVDGSASTQPVSGTVAVTQSTSPWVVSGTVTANQGGAPWSVSQSGTWTVQPGNTANTTPWLATVSQGGNSATVSAGGALKVDGSAATQPVSGTVAVSNLPTTADTNTGLAGASTLRVIAAGRASTTTTVATYDYTGGTVTTAAYTQIIASTTNAMNRLHVFDSSGSAIIIATGAVASEVDRIYLPPGGQPAVYEINIPASTRVSIKALDTNASTGRLILTGLN